MSINLGTGTLLFKDPSTGEQLTLSTEDVELTYETHSSTDTALNHFITMPELTFVDHGHIEPRTLLSLITGQHITNNWLKTHGGVMTRKGKGRKTSRNV